MPVFEMPLEQLQTYGGASPKPIGFDAYWEKALNALDKTGLDYQLIPADFDAPGISCFDLWFTGIRGAKIHCKLLRPRHPQGKLQGLAVFHGYMHHAGEWFERIGYAYAGMAVIVMDARGQGGLSEDAYMGSGPTLFGHIVRGVRDEDPQNLYYRDVYLDAAQTVRIFMSMDFVDETRIAATGNSQGGALALAAAALVPQAKRCAPVYPFLCDFQRVVDMDLNKGAYEGLYSYFKKCDPAHTKEKEIFNRLGYIDIQNLSPRIRAEILWQTGLMDTTCPPSTQFAAYNRISSPKQMRIYPEHAHEALPYANDAIFTFLTKRSEAAV